MTKEKTQSSDNAQQSTPSSDNAQQSITDLIKSTVARYPWLALSISLVLVFGGLVFIILSVVGFLQGRGLDWKGFRIEPQPTSQSTIALTESSGITSTATAITQTIKSIDDFPGQIGFFHSNNEVLSDLGELIVIRNKDRDLDYKLEYDIPQGGDKYVGFVGFFVRFTPTIDFTEYTSIKVSISFSDNAAKCEIYLEDQAEKRSSIRLGSGEPLSSSDIELEKEGDIHHYTIPLDSDTVDIPDKRSIENIGIAANADFTTGEHWCTIHEIGLLK